jgi:hypothetical protein
MKKQIDYFWGKNDCHLAESQVDHLETRKCRQSRSNHRTTTLLHLGLLLPEASREVQQNLFISNITLLKGEVKTPSMES